MHSDITSVHELVDKVREMDSRKKDLIVPTAEIEMEDDRTVGIPNHGRFEMTDYASGQLAQRLKIPKRFFDSLPERAPGARAHLVNELWHQQPERRMMRTMAEDPPHVRAYVSDRFRCYDNIFALQAILPTLQEMHDAKQRFTIKAAVLSPTRMYLQVMFDDRRAEIVPDGKHERRDEVVAYGATLMNSEVGAGAWDIAETVWKLVCSNALVMSSMVRKYHVGRRYEGGDDGIAEYFKDDTLAADVEAQRLIVRDVFHHAVTDAGHFEKVIQPLREAAGQKIEKPVQVVEEVTNRYGLSEGEQERLLTNVVEAGDLTRWGVINGVTALAHEEDNPDRQHEFEKIGTRIATMSLGEWGSIAN